MAEYISALAWILILSLFLCMFFHLKTVMGWSLELGVLCKSGRQSGHFRIGIYGRFLQKRALS